MTVRSGSAAVVVLIAVTVHAALLPVSLAGAERATSTTVNGQSNNVGIDILPAPADIAIDGNLGDWDWSGRIWIFADRGIRDSYSVEVAGMWDRDNLYLAAKWRDPTPMTNQIDPQFNPTLGWRADAMQLRLRTDRIVWLTTWYFTPARRSVLHIEYGKDQKTAGGGQVRLLTSNAKDPSLGHGAELSYRADPDGKGFVQEMKIPWKLLYQTVPPLAAGDRFQLGIEAIWGDPGGKNPAHRYADNLQPGVTNREFFWTATNAWGDASLRAEGGLTPRRYPADEEVGVAGPLRVRASLPESAVRFTLVIESAAGERVRNLVADVDPRDYEVAVRDGRRAVEVPWDGRDDRGEPVAPGRYSVRGLAHEGLDATYDMTFYNPGTPPWATADGRGAWAADHTPPAAVARAGDWMIISSSYAEGGSGLIGIGPHGRKQWGGASWRKGAGS